MEEVQSAPEVYSDGSALEAPVWALVRLAEVTAETYDRIENPGRYGDEGSSAAVLEWFPKLRAALEEAGMLR